MYQLTNNSFAQRLSHEVGWGYKDVVDRLEEKRKIKAQAFHERKVSKHVWLSLSSVFMRMCADRGPQAAPKGPRGRNTILRKAGAARLLDGIAHGLSHPPFALLYD